MKTLRVVLIFFLLLLAGTLFYSNRATLTTPYDVAYWKDRFDHSQWKLPLSTRVIGDDGLYAYEGYELIRGGDPSALNAEIPPLGRYAMGAVIMLTGNSAWYGVLSALLAASLLYILSKKILKSSMYALVVTAWFSSDLLFVSQWTATMLDSLHLAALLLFFILLGSIESTKRSLFFASLTGIALGIFAAIKYPIFAVMLFAGGAYYIGKQTRLMRSVFAFAASAIGVYLLSYTRYFLLGHTLLDWLRLQKWMFAFWTGSTLASNTGSIVTTLLFNRYQNLFTRTWEHVPEWGLSWPIAAVLTFLAAYRFFKHTPRRWNLFSIILWGSIAAFVAVYTVIPFWTRYLLLIMPFVYIGAATAVKSIKTQWVIPIVVLALLGCNLSTSWYGILPTPKEDVNQIIYDWKHGYFQDMYERFSDSTKANISRSAFLRNMQTLVREGEIEATDITIAPTIWQQFVSPQYVTLSITYHTRRLGAFTQDIRLPVIKEHGQWRIPWKPDFYITGLTRGGSLATTINEARRGAITNTNGAILARDLPGYMVWITPKLIDTSREQEMLKLLETIFGYPRFSAVSFYHRYIVNSPADEPVPLAVLPSSVSDDALYALRAYPGVTLTDALTRYQLPDKKDEIGLIKNTHFSECCSFLYTTTTYDGVSGLEGVYNGRLKGENGGTLKIIDSDGNPVRTLIEREKKDGEDVLL